MKWRLCFSAYVFIAIPASVLPVFIACATAECVVGVLLYPFILFFSCCGFWFLFLAISLIFWSSSFLVPDPLFLFVMVMFLSIRSSIVFMLWGLFFWVIIPCSRL